AGHRPVRHRRDQLDRGQRPLLRQPEAGPGPAAGDRCLLGLVGYRHLRDPQIREPVRSAARARRRRSPWPRYLATRRTRVRPLRRRKKTMDATTVIAIISCAIVLAGWLV